MDSTEEFDRRIEGPKRQTCIYQILTSIKRSDDFYNEKQQFRLWPMPLKTITDYIEGYRSALWEKKMIEVIFLLFF